MAIVTARASLQDLHDLWTTLILEDLKPRRTAVVITAVRAVVVVEVKIEVGYAQRFQCRQLTSDMCLY